MILHCIFIYNLMVHKNIQKNCVINMLCSNVFKCYYSSLCSKLVSTQKNTQIYKQMLCFHVLSDENCKNISITAKPIYNNRFETTETNFTHFKEPKLKFVPVNRYLITGNRNNATIWNQCSVFCT